MSRTFGVLALWLLATLSACGAPDGEQRPESDPRAALPAPPGVAALPIFIDASEDTGLEFRHVYGGNGSYYFPEIVGPGAALFDSDNDGDLDVYIVQGGTIGAPEDVPRPRDRLFRNDLEVLSDGGRRLRFTDVTAESRLDARGYGMGVAAGDFDNDGWTDLYVTNFGPNQLWRNNGDATFTDVTATAGRGVDDPRWSTSAAFLDFDRDGWLDLFVTNYIDYRLSNHHACTANTGRPDYCGPASHRGEPDRLLRNRGDGTFEDVSGPAGILTGYSSGLGVVTADFDGDGWIDVYVANDQRPNFLWMNRGDGTFEDEAMLAGAAVNMEGKSESSMGVDAGDLDNDGDDDLFLTHLDGETNTLYLNLGDAMFEDRTNLTGVGVPSRPFTGFGAALLDYDNDGWLDIIAANGAVFVSESLAAAGDPFPFHQTNQLFHNLGDGRFEDVSHRAGEVFALSEVSRGTAVGDIDNDGDVDALVLNNNGPARLMLNQVGQAQGWLGLRLVGEPGRRDMLGASVEVVLPTGKHLYRRARADASYLSANDPRVLIGLGDGSRVERVRVRWPSGRREEWTALESGRYSTLVEGRGAAVPEG